MSKPTEAQIKEFWEWWGFKDVGSRDKFKRLRGIRYPDGTIHSAYPPIDLNNLFKYAVAKAVATLEHEYGWEGLREFFKRWMHKMGEQSDHLEHIDFALALFWALWEVIKNE